jgi:hypothetical protein
LPPGSPRLPARRRGRRHWPLQRRRALFLVTQQFGQAGEVGFGGTELLLGILAPSVQSGNAGRFLKQKPALDRLGGDDRADLPLADQRRRMGSGRRVGEQQGDVLRADVAAIDPVRRAGAALDPPGDLAFPRAAFVAAIALDEDRDLGEVARRPRSRAGEDYIVHAAAAEGFGTGLAHRPADRFQQVRLTAAVGPNHPGQARLDPELGRFDEALETAELQSPDLQLRRPPNAVVSP